MKRTVEKNQENIWKNRVRKKEGAKGRAEERDKKEGQKKEIKKERGREWKEWMGEKFKKIGKKKRGECVRIRKRVLY